VTAAIFALFSPLNTPADQINLSTGAVVSQSTEFAGGAYPATNAIDGDVTTFTHTANIIDDYWMVTFNTPTPITGIEIVGRSGCCSARMEGLILRIMDENSNTLDYTTLSDPGLGGTLIYESDSVLTAKVVRIGIENGVLNGDNNYYVTLAEVRFYNDPIAPFVVNTNSLALNKDSFMVRMNDTVPPVSYGNDGNLNTEAELSPSAAGSPVDGYWEVDLGDDYAITNIVIAAPTLYADALAHTVVRLFDSQHNSVFSRKLDAAPPSILQSQTARNIYRTLCTNRP